MIPGSLPINTPGPRQSKWRGISQKHCFKEVPSHSRYEETQHDEQKSIQRSSQAQLKESPILRTFFSISLTKLSKLSNAAMVMRQNNVNTLRIRLIYIESKNLVCIRGPPHIFYFHRTKQESWSFLQPHMFKQQYLILMDKQKRTGIRLRHLDQPPNQHQNNSSNRIKGQKYGDGDPSRDKKSVSPSGKRKIFYPKSNGSFQNQYSVYPPSDKQSLDLDHLIETLKNKTYELEKKDSLIHRLKKQIDNLKTENQIYRSQVKKLKAELSIKNSQKTADHYQDPAHQKIKVDRPASFQNQVRRSFLDEPSRDQESMLSDIVSPLMALNGGEKSTEIRSQDQNQLSYPWYSNNLQNHQKNAKNRYTDKSSQPNHFNLTKDSQTYKTQQSGEYVPTFNYQAIDKDTFHPPAFSEKRKNLKIEDSKQFRFDDYNTSGLNQTSIHDFQF